MSSVGHSYAVLKGFRSGDPQKALDFLNSMPVEEERARNRSESRLRSVRKKKYRMGQRYGTSR